MVIATLVVAGIAAVAAWAFHGATVEPETSTPSAPAEASAPAAAQPSVPVQVANPTENSNGPVKSAHAPAPKDETSAPARKTTRHTHPKKVAVGFNDCREIATVHFTANSAELAPDEITLLRNSFNRAGELSGKLEIWAYCDDIGAADWNLVLSQRRANAVAKAVTSIQPDLQLETKGLGSDNPLVPNETWKARAQNRRAEVRICGPAQPK